MSSKPDVLMQHNAEQVWQSYQDLLQQHPHLHSPQAAKLLGVSEAALFIAMHQRDSENCLALKPDIVTLLQPVHDWRRLFAIQRNDLGVLIHLMHANVRFTDDTVQLYDAQQAVYYPRQASHYVFCVREQGHRGHSVSLNFFDQQGHILAKLFLRSKRGQAIAWPFWMRHQVALPANALQALPTFSPYQRSGSSLNAVQRAFLIGIRELSLLSESRVSLTGRSGHSQFQGLIQNSKADHAWAHISEPEFRAHFDAQNVSKLELIEGAQAELRAFDQAGGALRIQAQGAATRQWLLCMQEVLNETV